MKLMRKCYGCKNELYLYVFYEKKGKSSYYKKCMLCKCEDFYTKSIINGNNHTIHPYVWLGDKNKMMKWWISAKQSILSDRQECHLSMLINCNYYRYNELMFVFSMSYEHQFEIEKKYKKIKEILQRTYKFPDVLIEMIISFIIIV